MKKCFRQKKVYSLLLLLIFGSSCNRQDQTNHSGDEAKVNSPVQTVISSPDGDPSFNKSLDTVSSHGPRNITRDVLEDRNGNIWVASWDGIIRYDGKKFTNFTLKENLRRFHVFSILEDKAGNLWFGTIGAGVYKYDGKYFTNFTTNEHLAGNTVVSILEDKAGNIWFGTDSGASCFNGSSFINYSVQQGLSGNSVQAMTLDLTGKIWLGTNFGVSCYDGKSFTNFDFKPGDSFHNVRCILADRSGNIWIASREGLCRYDGKLITNLTPNLIGCIIEDKSGKFWLSGGGANSPDINLSTYDGSTFTKIISKENSPEFGKTEFERQIFGITEDRTGNIWFGTAKGICRYDGKSFTKFWE